MAKKGYNIYRRKDGRLEGRCKKGVSPEGKTLFYYVYGRSVSEVTEKLEKIIANKHSEVITCSLTFEELARKWVNSIKNAVKESTLDNYTFKLDKHILPYFGKTKYEKLTAEKFNDFVDAKIESGLSPKYVCDICRIVKAVCKFARKNYNYADKAEFMNFPKCEKKEIKILNKEQQDHLVSYLLSNKAISNLGVLLAVSTGMRIGELCALTWNDIDLEKRTIAINKTLQRVKCKNGDQLTKVIASSPKSKSSVRIIPIPDLIFSALKEAESDSDCYVLTGKKSYVEPRTVQYRFTALLKELSLPKVNFHALRHIFATRCVAAGFDVKTLSEILGHSSVRITMELYVHSSMEMKNACMKCFSESFKPSVLPSDNLAPACA